MKVGFVAKQNWFASEILRRLRVEHPDDNFSTWQSGEKAPSTELELIFAVGKVSSKDLEIQTTLGLIQMAAAGYEEVDMAAATSAGIWVASAPTTETGNGESVAEFAVLLMLAAARRLNEEVASVGQPPNPALSGMNRSLFGKTACIVGLGGIGNLLVERLSGFGMTLTCVDNHPEHAPKGIRGYAHDELKLAAAVADFLVLAIPGTKDNENMIDATVLAAMKKDAVLVNIGRGTLLDESALLAAVKSGHLYGAGLDVVKDEPVREGNPLLTEPRIFVTPHIAGATDLTLDGTVVYLGKVLAEFRQGKRPRGIVNEPGNPRVPLRHSQNR